MRLASILGTLGGAPLSSDGRFKHVKTKFQPYDVVRVVHLPSQTAGGTEDGFRGPRVGDTGAVVMVYEQPSEGYTVEAVAGDGSTEWLVDFLPGDLERV